MSAARDQVTSTVGLRHGLAALKTRLRKLAQPGLDSYRFAVGYLSYVRSGTTPEAAFHSMRQLFCLTNGRLNDSVAYVNRWLHPPREIDDLPSVLEPRDLSSAGVSSAVDDLRENGFHVFDTKVPSAICERLVEFARSTPMLVRGDDGSQRMLQYDSAKPAAVKYDCDQQVVMEHEDAQRLVTDPMLSKVAQAYLRAEPVQDMVALWWSTAFEREASSSAAQLYHFDLDRVRFLKFFIYLTDVTGDNGPHCFIRGSHRRKPRRLLRMERISDEEIFDHYGPEDVVEITGPQGTIVAVDTSGFHKGKPLVEGHRLILQIEFAIDLFGYNYPKIKVTDKFSSQFRAAMRSRPYTFANYVE